VKYCKRPCYETYGGKQCEDALHSQSTSCGNSSGALLRKAFGVRACPRVALERHPEKLALLHRCLTTSTTHCAKLPKFVSKSAPKLANVICGEARMSITLSSSKFMR
jgi:hypothetical protein